jgi:Cu2+-exporting ATPase
MVTGESIPVAKEPGCVVIAGTMNGNGTLNVRLTRLPGENSITDIANLVENAVAAKPRVQELADKVASWFIPVVVVIAVIVFCIWVAVAIRLRNRDGGGAVGMAITYAVAVLAVSCPCALGLAVPMVLVIAAGVSARAGVIIKAADVIERGHQVTDVVFDKTGTLTEGDLQVVHEMVLPNATLSKDAILALGKAMVDGNEHPVSAAVAAHLTSGMPTKISVEDSTSIPGAGIVAQYAGSSIKAGNPHWLNISDHPEVLQLFERAMTVFCMTIDEELVLIYGLKSTVRPNAAAVVAELRRRGINCHIVSGDNFAVVNDVARVLNIPEPNLFARSSPAEKQNYVNNLQTSVIGQDKKTKVLFIGDGTNDAVAIAQADVGVQMGSASDVTSAAADVVLLSKNLDGLLMLLDLSKAAVVRIRFNFIWSAVYNLFAILLASGASVKVRIPPAYAGLGEIVSVAPVVLAAMSLMWGKKHVRI